MPLLSMDVKRGKQSTAALVILYPWLSAMRSKTREWTGRQKKRLKVQPNALEELSNKSQTARLQQRVHRQSHSKTMHRRITSGTHRLLKTPHLSVSSSFLKLLKTHWNPLDSSTKRFPEQMMSHHLRSCNPHLDERRSKTKKTGRFHHAFPTGKTTRVSLSLLINVLRLMEEVCRIYTSTTISPSFQRPCSLLTAMLEKKYENEH